MTLIKEALVDAISKKKFVLSLVDTDPDYTNCIKFKDGVMYLYTSPKKFYLWLNFYSDSISARFCKATLFYLCGYLLSGK
jgi:hypothetical protein